MPVQDAADQSLRRGQGPSRLTREAGSPGDLTFLLRCVRRHRRLVTAAALVGLGLGLFAQLTLSKRYVAVTQMMLDYRRLVNVSPQEAVFNFRLSDAALDSQTEILMSDGVLGRAVDALNLAQDPEFIGGDGPLSRALVSAGLIGDAAGRPLGERRQNAVLALRKALKVERLGLSYVIEITASAKTPEKAVKLADGMTDAYIADQMDARRSVASGALDWFETRLRDLQADVTQAQHDAIEYRLANQIMLSDGKFIDEQQVQDLSSRLIAAQERRFIAQARLTRANAIVDGQRNLDGVLSGSLGEEMRDPVIVALLTGYHDVSRRMQQNLGLYGPTHGAVLKDQVEMRSLQDNIVSQFKQIAAGARSDAEIAGGDEESVRAMLKQAAAQAAQGQRARVELTLLQGAADSMTALRDNFVLQYSMSTQQQTFPITETRVTSRASLPFEPAWPTPRKTLVGGLALGLIAGFSLAVGSEALSRRLRKRSDLEAVTGRRCLGYLPVSAALSALGGSRAVLDARTGPDAFAVERLRATLLDLDRQGGRPSGLVLGVVGAKAGEGATTAAAAIAVTAVAAGRRVLLIDADLRNASSSARFAPLAREGLAEALADPRTVPAPVPCGGGERLACLPAGGRSGAPEAILDADAFARLIDRLRPDFDLIMVDCPPLAPSVAARSIADALDAYLLVVRWNATTKDIVTDCLDANPEVGAKLLGAVFNRILLRHADMIDDAALTHANASLRARRAGPFRRASPGRWAANLFQL